AGIITVSEVEVCDSTPTAVTPKLTVDAGMNPVPVIVSVVAGAPATRLDGESDVTVGDGLFAPVVTVNPTALDWAAPGFTTVTGTAPDADDGIVKSTVIVLLLTNVPPKFLPLNRIAAPFTKFDPVTVIVTAVPAWPDDGETTVTTGVGEMTVNC